MSALKRTYKPDQNSPSNFLVEKAANDAQQLDGAVWLGHVVIAAGGPRLLLITLHGEGTDRNDRDRCKAGQRLDLPRGAIAEVIAYSITS
jgi:hypothetical protein